MLQWRAVDAALPALLAYAIGCLPFAVLVARSQGVDVRAGGSGNPGATNVGRLVGPGWGRLVLLLDIAKGYLAVSLLSAWPGVFDADGRTPVLVLVVLGHVYPVTSGFRGGKGVATLVGGFLALDPWLGLACVAVREVVKRWTGFVSASSVVLAWSFPCLQWLVALLPLPGERAREGSWLLVALALLITIRHRDNFRRIREGTEDRYDDPDPET